MDTKDLVKAPSASAMVPDGLEDAVIGTAEIETGLRVLVVSIPKAIGILVDGGMDYDDARDYLDFNSVGAWVGDGTPIWIEATSIWGTRKARQ